MKKIISLLIAAIMAFSSVGVFALDLEDAYDEFKSKHPEFIESLIAQGISENTIFSFMEDVYDYIMEIDETTPVTKSNFEEHAMTAINRVSARTEYTSVQDALIILYPDAIRLALTEGKVHASFRPLVDTIKSILFTSGGGSSGGSSAPDSSGKDEKPEKEDPPVSPEEPEAKLFSDIDEGHWAYAAVKTLSLNMILNGYLDGTFKPENNITRAEFAKIIVSATDSFDHSATSAFSDVSADDWYYSYVSSAYKLGYITGYPDGSFHPEDNISRADICTIVNRVLKATPGGSISFTDDANIPSYAKDAVYALASRKIINGFADGSFLPTAYATRAQTAKIIYTAFFSN